MSRGSLTVTGSRANDVATHAVEYALKGLLMGPLAWDVWLLQRALDSATVNEVRSYLFTLLLSWSLTCSRRPS